MNGNGASMAASGIQVWNGMAPALAMAPRPISTKAAAPRPIGSRWISDMVRVPDSCQAKMMPRIMAKSAMPEITKALVAVLKASLLPTEIMPYRVASSDSQKNNITTKLLARMAPLASPAVSRK